jgi:hypothetical protein
VICITCKDRKDHLPISFAIAWHNVQIPDIKRVDVLYSMMSAQATLSQPNIEQTLEQILASQKITLSDQRWLISLCFEGSLSCQQEHLVNQVYEALRNGLLIVIDARRNRKAI